MPDQFWNAEEGAVRTDALLKAFNDTKADRDRLKGQLAEGEGEGAPEKAEDYLTGTDLIEDDHFRIPEGDLDKVKGIYPDGVPTDDPMLKGFAESAQRLGLSQKQFTGIVSDFLTMQEGALPDGLDVEAEFEALGANGKGKDRVKAYNAWTDGLAASGILSKDDVNVMRDFGTTASEIRVLEKVMAYAEQKSVQNLHLELSDVTGDAVPTLEEWYAMKPKAGASDAEFEKWEKIGEKVNGTGPAGSSKPGIGMPASRGITSRA